MCKVASRAHDEDPEMMVSGHGGRARTKGALVLKDGFEDGFLAVLQSYGSRVVRR